MKRLIRLVFPFALGLCCVIAAQLLVENVDFLNVLEAKALYGELPQLPENKKTFDQRILIIKLTKNSARKFGIQTDGLQPFRPLWGQLLTALDAAKAGPVLVDIQFVNPSTKPLDEPLVRALRGLLHTKVILAAPYPNDEEGEISKGRVGYHFSPAFFQTQVNPKFVLFGSPACVTDQDGSFLGVFPMQYDLRTNVTVYQVALLLVLEFFHQQGSELHLDLESHRLSTGPISWQLSSQNLMIPEATIGDRPFEEIELSDAIQRLKSGNDKLFRNRLIVVGVDDGTHDIHPTVQFGTVPGVVYQAHMVNAFMQSTEERKRELPEWVYWTSFTCLAAGTMASAIQFRSIKSYRLGESAGLAVTTVLLAVLLIMLSLSSNLVPIVTLSLILVISVTAGLLCRLLCPSILEKRVPGELLEGTILFLDLEDSTRLVQELGAIRYTEIYRRFTDQVRACVEKEDGVVERTTGDGCIAVFEATSKAHHATRCAKAALTLLQEDFRPEVGGRKVGFTVGLESGVFSGTYVIEGKYRQWSSSGATVNLAQRLQSCATKLGVRVAIGPAAKRFIEESFDLKRVDSAELKGFEFPVEVWSFRPSL